jgi:hypothetical protein
MTLVCKVLILSRLPYISILRRQKTVKRIRDAMHVKEGLPISICLAHYFLRFCIY